MSDIVLHDMSDSALVELQKQAPNKGSPVATRDTAPFVAAGVTTIHSWTD